MPKFYYFLRHSVFYGALIAHFGGIPSAEAAAGAGWKLYESERNCSLGKSSEGGFTFLTIWADGRQGLRFHDKDWQIEGRAPVTVRVTADDHEFEFIGNPASTSDGSLGIYGMSDAPVLEFLADDAKVTIEANGFVLGQAMTDGLVRAFPLLKACGAALPVEERKDLPSGTPALMVMQPTIPANALPASARWEQARYEVVVGVDGLVTSCRIIEPEVTEASRAAICNAISTRARFRPARLSNGQAIEAKLRGSISR